MHVDNLFGNIDKSLRCYNSALNSFPNRAVLMRGLAEMSVCDVKIISTCANTDLVMLADKIATYEKIKRQLDYEISLDDLEMLVKFDADLVAAWNNLLDAPCESSEEKLELATFLLDQIDENVESTVILEQIKSKILEMMKSMI